MQDPVFEVVLGQSSMLELHGSQGRAFCHCIEATLSAPAASTANSELPQLRCWSPAGHARLPDWVTAVQANFPLTHVAAGAAMLQDTGRDRT